jgi:uncharacterized protein (TIGR02284 family)
MPGRSHLAEEVQELIQICRDSQEGYRDGAEHAKNSELKRLLNEVSLERAKFASDLEREAIRWGKPNVDRSGTVQGAVQHGWAGLKSALGGGDDAILSSLEAGDEFARQHYDDAIKDEQIPAEIIGVLRNQAQAIVGTLDRIRALRRNRKAA